MGCMFFLGLILTFIGGILFIDFFGRESWKPREIAELVISISLICVGGLLFMWSLS